YRFSPINGVSMSQLWYGDLIYADRNGDGAYGDADDLYYTGQSQLPKFNYGFSVELSYGNFDLSVLWFGSAGYYIYWNKLGYYNNRVSNGYGVPKKYVENMYRFEPSDPDNPKNNINGELPRLM